MAGQRRGDGGAAAALPAPAAKARATPGSRPRVSGASVVLAFVPAGESELASVSGLSVGLMSATQGRYTTTQLLLDTTQGARVSSSAYAQARPPKLSLTPAGAGGLIAGWPAALRRAENAPQLLQPGLLATQLPGGAAYAGVAGAGDIDGLVASNREGHLAALSLGSAPTLLTRIAALRASRRLVVCDLPGGAQGLADLRALNEGRHDGELLLVVQRAPTRLDTSCCGRPPRG